VSNLLTNRDIILVDIATVILKLWLSRLREMSWLGSPAWIKSVCLIPRHNYWGSSVKVYILSWNFVVLFILGTAANLYCQLDWRFTPSNHDVKYSKK
jgi:hypothetical protein